MDKLKLYKYLSYVIIFETLQGMNLYSKFIVGNGVWYWISHSIFILLLLYIYKKYRFNKIYTPVKIFLLYLIYTAIRSPFYAEHYYDWKLLFDNLYTYTLFLGIMVFSIPSITSIILRNWIKYAIPIFLLYALFFISPNAYGFFLSPLALFALFIPTLNKKYKIIILLAVIFLIISDISARSTVLKNIVPLFLIILYYVYVFTKNVQMLNIIQKICFISPIFFFILAAIGIFNVFNTEEYIGKEVTIEYKTNDKEIKETNLLGDTRTFIYNEVIGSAVNNNYVLFGRSLSRGNDSMAFGESINEALKLGRFERQKNEVGILNIFTQMGIIGVLLVFLIYYKASTLAINRSRNPIIKIVGIYIAFRWCLLWIEDNLKVDINTITIVIILGMCYSPTFRNMDLKEIKYWIKYIFKNKKYEKENSMVM